MNQQCQITISPRVDIFENEDQYFMLADLPGVQAKALDISYENEHLELKASTDEGSPDFARRFHVPNIADDKIIAKLNDGILQLELPKASAAKPRTVRVQSE